MAKVVKGPLVVSAEVVRVSVMSKYPKPVYGIGVMFRFPKEGNRDPWVQLTFDLQRGVRTG
jgi:hypothetical protein